MTTRPKPKHSRPNSAVYIGSDPLLHKLASTPPGIPDLPEPPDDAYPADFDESESDRDSGLPSPPATNSTGSGSTGDPASIALRNRNTNNMLNESNVKTFHAAFSSSSSSSAPDNDDYHDINDDDLDDDEDGGDHTAKLLRRQSLRSPTSSENSQTLERVKSLTERNRMALDKLSSISRLSSPSPKPPTPSSSNHKPSASTSNTRPSRLQNVHQNQNQPDRSGSETERESVRGDGSHHSRSPELPTTSLPSILSNSNRPTTPRTQRTTRTRLISAPASPAKALQLRAAGSSSSSQSNVSDSPRKRVSMAMSDLTELRNGGSMRRVYSPEHRRNRNGYDDADADADYSYDYETPSRSKMRADDIAQAALAAVASTRSGSATGTRTRQPLPKEFREASTSSSSSSAAKGSGSVSRRSSVSSSVSRGYDEDDDEREDDRRSRVSGVNRSGSGNGGRFSNEPMTPHRPQGHTSRPSLNLSPRLQRNLNNSLGNVLGDRDRDRGGRERRDSTASISLRDRDRDRATIGRSSTLSSLGASSTSGSAAGSIRRHGHQTRWYSEDMSSTGGDRDDLISPDVDTGHEGRKQVVRGTGSADSALTATLAGGAGPGPGNHPGLGSGSKTVGRKGGMRALLSGGGGGGARDVFDDTPLRDRDRDRDRSTSRNQNRSRSRAGWDDDSFGDGDDLDYDADRERTGSRLERERERERTRAGTIVGPRAATSMTDYRDRDRDRDRDWRGGERARDRDQEESMVRVNGSTRSDEPLTAPPTLRSYNSSYPLPLGRGLERRERDFDGNRDSDRERAPSALSSHQNTISRNRNSIGHTRTDHYSLLNESLRMFESNVSRMPSTTSASVSDLLRNAQTIVTGSEKLSMWLREANQKALENQIEAEVEVDYAGNGSGSGSGPSPDALAEVWRKVGGEYREGVRVSDELVRAVTDFLLGVGKAVKDMNGGSEHGRSVSLDEVVVRARSRAGLDGGRGSLSPDVDGLGRAGSARGSSGAGSRPPSAFNLRDREREREREERYETPPPARALSRQAQTQGQVNGLGPPTGGSSASSSSASKSASLSAGRALSRNGLNGAAPGILSTFDSQETIQGYEPSPTPASRQARGGNTNTNANTNIERSRTLPPISIPKPLPTLPSETKTPLQAPGKSRRQASESTDKSNSSSTSLSRRRTTPHSATVRGPSFPALSTPNLPTTQLTTHHVSNTGRVVDSPLDGRERDRDRDRAGDKLAFPLTRSDSDKSATRTTVTFSRSSTVSVNALTGLQQQQQMVDRRRARAASGASASGEESSGSRPKVMRSDTEGVVKRQPVTVGRQVRMSLDGSVGRDAGLDLLGTSVNSTASTVHPADRSAALSSKRERRGTVVDLWARGGS